MNEPIPPLPERSVRNAFQYEPMREAPTVWAVVSALLKQPGQIACELLEGRAAAVLGALSLVTLVALAAYGVVAGSLAGGDQLWIAPAKIVLGSAAAALICFPSLYVFLCMNGADAKLHQVAGVFAAGVCLMAVLLVSLSPIAWIFSQSTDSVALMAALHILLWMIALGFGLRLLSRSAAVAWCGNGTRLGLWACIYVLVCLQMMTAVRPIIGTSHDLLPQEKKFFLAHWLEVMRG